MTVAEGFGRHFSELGGVQQVRLDLGGCGLRCATDGHETAVLGQEPPARCARGVARQQCHQPAMASTAQRDENQRALSSVVQPARGGRGAGQRWRSHGHTAVDEHWLASERLVQHRSRDVRKPGRAVRIIDDGRSRDGQFTSHGSAELIRLVFRNVYGGRPVDPRLVRQGGEQTT